MRTRIIVSLFATIITIAAHAQGGTKSPYSQFGLGLLSDQSQSMNRGMGGVGVGMRVGNQVNMLNPASYSGVDSLSMLFDAGMSLQVTNFKEGAVRQNAKMANFEYLAASFRVFKNVGMAFGVVPLTSVGYSYSTSTFLDDTNGSISETFSGSGGLNQAFLGVGMRLFSPLSVGVNISYLWGDIDRTVLSSSTTYVNALQKQYSASVSNYKLDAGIQWEQRIGKLHRVTLGATYSLPHKLDSDPKMMLISTNTVSSNTDTTTFKIRNGLKLPLMLAGGLSYTYADKLIVAADGSFQRWGTVSEPYYDTTLSKYVLKGGLNKNRYKGGLGVEFTPNRVSRKLYNRVSYRLGASYSTPYYYINGKEGPSELNATIGLGIPIMNLYNNRSMLNISGQWVHHSATGLIKENTFRINIGLTFNERWFAKWRVE
ncbi:MAG: hypothetical protein IJP74_10305 [Prevotella sp.]|nr:hypothetical protein [Prevotella sp.]